ncbi:hypothetical protein SLS59_003788 [Nothophoma quercina]|uniref:Prefoldin subunit 1 n=1 Tax=Nothophoma quercina TaxID=749835 RepID=A0ABR3RJX8_9PLEO
MAGQHEAVQKMLQEIQQKMAFSEQQLLIVRQQKAARTREGRMLQLTSAEVSSLPAETKVYEGVGKMFVCTPIPDVQKRLETEEKAMKAEMTNLNKKEDYLEMTYKNSKSAIEEALKRQV